jgi:hypothetical protein
VPKSGEQEKKIFLPESFPKYNCGMRSRSGRERRETGTGSREVRGERNITSSNR